MTQEFEELINDFIDDLYSNIITKYGNQTRGLNPIMKLIDNDPIFVIDCRLEDVSMAEFKWHKNLATPIEVVDTLLILLLKRMKV